jgi:8-oxo-dGTP diphosphatase
MSAFESGERKLIPAVLVYLRQGSRTLMIHKKQAGSIHQGKWNGIGGKMEVDESPLGAALREVREESGCVLDSSRLKALGVLQFPGFKAEKSEDWLVYVFTGEMAEEEAREVRKLCDEGELHWVETRELLGLKLWPGDRHFLPYIERREPFWGTLWYRDGEVVRHEMTKL